MANIGKWFNGPNAGQGNGVVTVGAGGGGGGGGGGVGGYAGVPQVGQIIMGPNGQPHGVVGPNGQTYPLAMRDPYSEQLSDVGMIAMRMGWNKQSDGFSPMAPFKHISVCRINDEKFAVFLVVKDEPVTIMDDSLFPSDKLITQLRLLLG